MPFDLSTGNWVVLGVLALVAAGALYLWRGRGSRRAAPRVGMARDSGGAIAVVPLLDSVSGMFGLEHRDHGDNDEDD